MIFDVRKLIADVFCPEANEVIVVACDMPADAHQDTQAWRERRQMANEWRSAFVALGAERSFRVEPLLTYSATGSHNAELPARATLGANDVSLEQILLQSTLAVFMTQYSATAPLTALCGRKSDFRAASLPGLERRMEQSGLAADYRAVAQRCAQVARALDGAVGLDVSFSTGHRCFFDLRHRAAESEDGFLPRGKQGDRVINLPAGEVFVVPYEGERDADPSDTAGSIPIHNPDGLIVCRVEANRIVHVEGDGREAQRLRSLFGRDPACANVAEVAFGCNDRAVVTGNVLEDEKAGFHWAYGRSEHLGGTVGPKAFLSAENVVHQDIVYARGNPIRVAEATVHHPQRRSTILLNGEYTVF